MAVRQYVGARYVPKFADPVAWQSGTSYEALTIVTYNNASYTSKIPVPATVGNPADNDSYWALTGNYNAQVENYRQTTLAVQENLNDEVNNREDADTALGERITQETETRETADNTLKQNVNENSTSITNINNQLKPYKNLYGKQIAIYGDSWCDSGNPYHAWIDVLNDATGTTAHVVAAGGYTMAQINDSFDNYNADIYIIEGGINDCVKLTPLQTFSDAILGIINKIRAVNANAEIFAITPASQLSPVNLGEGYYYEIPFETYRQVIWHNAQVGHIKVISGNKSTNFAIYTQADGLHPTPNANNLKLVGQWVLDGIMRDGDERDYNAYERCGVSTGFITWQDGAKLNYSTTNKAFTSGLATMKPEHVPTSFFTIWHSETKTTYVVLSGSYINGSLYWDANGMNINVHNSSTNESDNTAQVTSWVIPGECS